MTIYILDQNLQKSAEYLDDKSLDKQIKTIAQILSNVHHAKGLETKLTYKGGKILFSWTDWGMVCKANYLWLAEYGLDCCNEWWVRFVGPCLHCDEGYDDEDCHCLPLSGQNELANPLQKIIEWARDNVPDLPFPTDDNHSFLPLVMPKKYIAYHLEHCLKTRKVFSGLVESYRNYYKSKLEMICRKQRIKDGGEYELKLYLDNYHEWTNRKKPEWLNL
jgi:Pyrimidine dimer DNA glycosylase